MATERRHFLQAALALAAAGAISGPWARALAQQRLTEAELLAFEPLGNVTLIHLTDLHAQFRPIWFREPDTNFGVGPMRGLVPHLTGRALLNYYGIEPGSALAHALTHEDFEALARAYGRMGGLDRIARVIKAIRAERPGALLLDGGDTWQGSYTALQTRGADVVAAMAALSPDAMTSHWEWTLGADRVQELVETLGFPFLGQNVFDAEWDEPALDPYALFERGGVLVGVIGQAFPYTPIANPAWMFPGLSFGIRERRLQELVEEVRGEGADLVVVLSHNGFDVDRKLAERVRGIDVILTGHTHDALPAPVQVGETLLIASGSHGKFVSRLDLDVADGRVRAFRHKLIPIFADALAPDTEMTALIAELRAPYEAYLSEVIGETTGLLWRRGNFGGTWDRLITAAIREQREVEIALSPGVRWGASVMPGPITREDVFNVTAMTYPACYRTTMTGEQIKAMLEDIADNLFNPDPFYQQGGDMVRIGGLSYHIDVSAPMGQRISDLRLNDTDEPLDPARSYTVGGWGSVHEGVEGPPIWEVIEAHLRARRVIEPDETIPVTVSGA